MRTVPGPSCAARSVIRRSHGRAPVPGRAAGAGGDDELHGHVGQRVGCREGEQGAGVVADRDELGHRRLELGRLAVGRDEGVARLRGCRSHGAADEHGRGGDVLRDRGQPGAGGDPGGPGGRGAAELQPGGLETGVGRVDEHQAAHHLRAGAGQALGEEPAVRVADDDHRVGGGVGGGLARGRAGAASTVESRSTSSGRSTTRCHGVDPPMPGRSKSTHRTSGSRSVTGCQRSSGSPRPELNRAVTGASGWCTSTRRVAPGWPGTSTSSRSGAWVVLTCASLGVRAGRALGTRCAVGRRRGSPGIRNRGLGCGVVEPMTTSRHRHGRALRARPRAVRAR